MQLRGASDFWTTIETRSSSQIESARPITSNPGPMFAEEQGTSVFGVSDMGTFGVRRLMLTYGDHFGGD